MQTRAESVRAIQTEQFDLCVIGGGATGSGCALEAQLRGLRTALIDAGDFASATSSASTKLVHGGIRYLEEAFKRLDLGQLKVIREALRERAGILHNAPYLAHTREFLIPCFNSFERFYYGFGVGLYDWLAGSGNLAHSHRLPREATLDRFPELAAPRLTGSVLYTDGQFDDARLCIALVETFAHAGGRAANYVKLNSFAFDPQGKVCSARVEDRNSSQTFEIRARAFLNATGPYSDEIRRLASAHVEPRLVHSRGVHILLPLTRETESTALLIPRTEDGRVIFAIPWIGRLLVGTTDQEVSDLHNPPVTRDEAEYLLRHLNRYARRQHTRSEIVSAFAGIRPLVKSGHGSQTKQLARDHQVEIDSKSGLVSILGGKWTTYRAMAEDAIHSVQKYLGLQVSPSRSLNHSLSGSEGYTADYPSHLSARHSLPPSQATHLAGKFGSSADEICAIAQRDVSLWRRLAEGFPAIEAEVAYSVRNEMAQTIEDVLARRIGLQYFSWSLSAKAAEKVARHFVGERGWSEHEAAHAIAEYLDRLQRMQSAIGLSTDPAKP